MDDIPSGQISDRPLREANTRGSRNITGTVFSAKTGTHLDWVGLHEQRFIIRAELDPRTTRILYQPVRYDVLDGEGGSFTACHDVQGAVIGIQRNFIDMVGRKARMTSPRLSLGQIRGGALRLGPEAAEITLVEGVEVHRSDFEALLARVASLPEGDGDDIDYLPSIALNAKRGASYRQRFLFEDVLSGRIRSKAAGDGSEGLKGRRLHRADFERQRMLAKTACQIIADEFVGVPTYLPALWGLPAPSRGAVAALRDEGRIRTRGAKAAYRDLVSVRDLVGVVQEDGGRRIYNVAAATEGGIGADDWRSIVVDDLCAGRSRR